MWVGRAMLVDRFRCRDGFATDQCILIKPTASSDSNSTFVTS
jgi:hypothetical protein